MKKKFEPSAKVYPLTSFPGRYAVIRQWVNGGPLHWDTDYGKGYTAEDASRLASEFNRKAKQP